MSDIATRATAAASPSRTKVITLGAAVAVAAFVLGPVLFVPNAANPEPTSGQLAGFVVLAVIEAVVFGVGVVFAAFGRRHVQRLFSTSARATAVHLSVTWALVSWWPHDNLHMVNGMNIGGLLLIEYAFHVTLIVAAIAVAWAFFAEAREVGRR